MAKGIVKWFDPHRGFGFVLDQEGIDIFVHYSEIEKEGFRCLRTGQEVEFTLAKEVKGLQAKSVRITKDIEPEIDPEQEQESDTIEAGS